MIETFSIAHVEQVTGLSKEVLRMWERRYGYPQPERDAQGDRLYTSADIAKLGLIRQLMEQGQRPGKLVNQPLEVLQHLYRQGMAEEENKLGELVPLLKKSDVSLVQEWLENRIHSQGLKRFVCESLPQLNQNVGEGWENGILSVYEEHLYAEQINNLLRRAITSLTPASQGAPRVLLTTPPGELHGLGLLMVEALLRVEGFAVVSLGTSTPFADIVAAAHAHQTQIVALSFSVAYSPEQAREDLVTLRAALPAGLALWAGGRATQGLEPLAGVALLPSLPHLLDQAHAFRS